MGFSASKLQSTGQAYLPPSENRPDRTCKSLLHVSHFPLACRPSSKVRTGKSKSVTKNSTPLDSLGGIFYCYTGAIISRSQRGLNGNNAISGIQRKTSNRIESPSQGETIHGQGPYTKAHRIQQRLFSIKNCNMHFSHRQNHHRHPIYPPLRLALDLVLRSRLACSFEDSLLSDSGL